MIRGTKSDSSADRKPRFKVRDQVTIVGPDPHKGRIGVVIQVISSPVVFSYRYDVRFSDGTSARYFGFQLELVETQSTEFCVRRDPRENKNQ